MDGDEELFRQLFGNDAADKKNDDSEKMNQDQEGDDDSSDKRETGKKTSILGKRGEREDGDEQSGSSSSSSSSSSSRRKTQSGGEPPTKMRKTRSSSRNQQHKPYKELTNSQMQKLQNQENDSATDRSRKTSGKKKKKNSRSSKASCSNANQSDDDSDVTLEKRPPQKPTKTTQKQIDFLSAIADEPDGCTCYRSVVEKEDGDEEKDDEEKDDEQEDDEQDDDEQENEYKDNDDWAEMGVTMFEDLAAAEEAARAAFAGEAKGQRCYAYSVMSKNGDYIVVATNSSHSQMEHSTVEKGESSFLRPAIEPRVPDPPVLNIRYCILTSCEKCNEIEVENSVIIDSKTDFTELVDDDALKIFLDEERERKAVVIKLQSLTENYDCCRVVFYEKIQPNETAKPAQEGWSVHHAEIESYFFAKRRGWTIEKIFIDRDCCLVCAATLNRMAKDEYDKIELIGSK